MLEELNEKLSAKFFAQSFPGFEEFLKLRELQKINMNLEEQLSELKRQEVECIEMMDYLDHLRSMVMGYNKGKKDDETEIVDVCGVNEAKVEKETSPIPSTSSSSTISTRRSYARKGIELVDPFRYWDCLICTKGFYKEKELRYHYARTHGMCWNSSIDTPTSMQDIDEYGRQFCWKDFAIHINHHYNDDDDEDYDHYDHDDNKHSKDETEEEKPMPPGIYECKNCQKKFWLKIESVIHELCCGFGHEC